MGPVLGGEGWTHAHHEGWGGYPGQHPGQDKLELDAMTTLGGGGEGGVVHREGLCALYEVTQGQSGLAVSGEQVQLGREVIVRQGGVVLGQGGAGGVQGGVVLVSRWTLEM